jgi:hypothetical protein
MRWLGRLGWKRCGQVINCGIVKSARAGDAQGTAPGPLLFSTVQSGLEVLSVGPLLTGGIDVCLLRCDSGGGLYAMFAKTSLSS